MENCIWSSETMPHLIVDKLAANSPLMRWPTGQQTPDQGQPGSTEDVLLKRQNDANGHAAGIRARVEPSGAWIWMAKTPP